ncbi:MAG: hypothetical protein ACLFV7_09770 [Phycisphaerae bacterium]
MTSQNPLPLTPAETLGTLEAQTAPCPLSDATWYRTDRTQAGMAWDVPAGMFARDRWLTIDLLVDGVDAPVFELRFKEQPGELEDGFRIIFGLLNQCQARVRVPLTLCDGDVWLHGREGAWLKACCYGQAIDPAKVRRVELALIRKAEGTVRWAQGPLTVHEVEPARIEEPLLPGGKLLDELGQFVPRNWPGKTRSTDELTRRLQSQHARAADAAWPEGFSRWGGCRERSFEATGWFRTHHDGDRWWLVDPDGSAFFSAGVDCIRPGSAVPLRDIEPALQWVPPGDGEFADAWSDHRITGEPSVSFLVANLIRGFGADGWIEAWRRTVVGLLREWGFNSFGNWSQWSAAAMAGFPYVRPLRFGQGETRRVFRDFPDVFSDSFARDAAAFATQLQETADDPAMIGYFLMNEPKWGFASECPAAGMLRVTDQCDTRDALADWLHDRYGMDDALAGAWGMDVSRQDVRSGLWTAEFTPQATADLEDFSTVMVDRLFASLSDACRQVDPNHLNLGARYYIVPPAWALAGMNHFDVFSINCYDVAPNVEQMRQVSGRLGRPMMIGEWHFGAQDAGIPCSGICRVGSQADRGKAYRRYFETAASADCLVGVHYFQMYDQSALGRFDGENYNIGLLDVCHRPYEPLTAAARESHRRMYDVAAGKAEPFGGEVDDRPRLFY